MTPKEEALFDAYVAGIGNKQIECSMCQSFTIEIKDGEDEAQVIKEAGFAKCVDCGNLLCEECGFTVKGGAICDDCISDRRQDDYYDRDSSPEDTPCIEWNGFNKPSTY